MIEEYTVERGSDGLIRRYASNVTREQIEEAENVAFVDPRRVREEPTPKGTKEKCRRVAESEPAPQALQPSQQQLPIQHPQVPQAQPEVEDVVMSEATRKPSRPAEERNIPERKPQVGKRTAKNQGKQQAEFVIGNISVKIENLGNGEKEMVVSMDGSDLARIKCGPDGKGDLITARKDNATVTPKGKAKARNVYIEEPDLIGVDSEDEGLVEDLMIDDLPTNENGVVVGRSRARFFHGNEFIRPLFAKGSPTAQGWIGESQLDFVLDSGSEICVMPEEVFRASRLPWAKAKWAMVNVDGGVSHLRKVCTNAPVRIHEVVIPVHIFVSEHLKGIVLLGRPFEVRSRLKSSNLTDGSLVCSIAPLDGGERSYWTACEAGERSIEQRKDRGLIEEGQEATD